MLYPDAVHWRSDGALLVADTGANRIQVWTPDGQFLTDFGGPSSAVRLFGLVAVLFVAAGVGGFLLLALGILASRAIPLVLVAVGISAAVAWGALSVTSPPGLRNPRDIWVDAADQSYVADYGSDVVRVFDAGGHLALTIGRPGSGPGELRRPLGVTIDGAGQVLVTDAGNHRVQVFTKGGDFVTSVGGPGLEPGRFQSPHGIAAGPNGWWSIADRGNGRVQILRPDGTHVMTIDRATDGTPFTPVGLCVTPNGDVFVADSAGHRVLTWPAAWLREALNRKP